MLRDKSSDGKKLGEMYEKYKNRMYITACRILGDPYRAEDAVHDAFVAISKNLGKIDDTDSVAAASYCIKAAKNTAYNMVKKQKKETVTDVLDFSGEVTDDAFDEICTKENFRLVVKAVKEIDEKYRDVLSLYYFNELTISEIAISLSRKENTVKQQLARGRRMLLCNIEKEVKKYE